jgi:cohesin loading factor subunit SCC2
MIDPLAPLEKLTAFIEEIFEAEDSLQPDAELDELPKEWFSIHTVDVTRPLLAEGIIRKLTKLTSQIARPRKRMRLARDTPRKPGAGTLSEMETVMLSRMLKILERSVKVGEDVDPFGAAERKGSPAKASGKATAGAKKGKAGSGAKAKGQEPPRGRDGTDASGRARSRSRSPMDEGHIEGGNAMDEKGSESVLTEQDFQKLEKSLEVAKESVLAADCCIAFLAADKLPKQVSQSVLKSENF